MTQKQDIFDRTLSRRPACIVLPTTDGLVWICGLKERSASLKSHMTLVGDFRQLGISREYHQFVSMPLKQVRTDGASVQLELSKEIDSGRSWEFPVLLAHILHGHGLLAFPDLAALEEGNDPGCDLVWATGKLDADLVPVAGNYSLSQKFCLSGDILEKFRHHGRQVDIVLGGPLSEDDRRQTLALASHFDLGFDEVHSFGEISFLNEDVTEDITEAGTGLKSGSDSWWHYAGEKMIMAGKNGGLVLKNGKLAISSFLVIIGLSVGFSSFFSGKIPSGNVTGEEKVSPEAAGAQTVAGNTAKVREADQAGTIVQEGRSGILAGTQEQAGANRDVMKKTIMEENRHSGTAQTLAKGKTIVPGSGQRPDQGTVRGSASGTGSPEGRKKATLARVVKETAAGAVSGQQDDTQSVKRGKRVRLARNTPVDTPSSARVTDKGVVTGAVHPSVIEGFVIEQLMAADRGSCRASIMKKQYCVETGQDCRIFSTDSLAESVRKQPDVTQDENHEYLVTGNRNRLCGLRFRNTGEKPVSFVLDRRIERYAFPGSDGIFGQVTLRPGQGMDMYLERVPSRLATGLKLEKEGAEPAGLTLKF